MITPRRSLILALVLLLAAMSAPAARAAKPAPTGDRTPPAAIADLSVDPDHVTTLSVTLRWTATGDDGTRGTATKYDLRYQAGAPITDVNWDAAIQADMEPRPQASGLPEIFVLGGLSEATTYHFALKVLDDANNLSALSNNASATTLLALPGDWAVETATTMASISRQFAFGPAGQVGIAHGYKDGLWLTRWDGTTWTDERVVGAGQGLNPYPDIAYTPDGSPSMVFGLEDPLQQYNLKFAYRLNGAWVIDELGVARNSGRPSLAYDPATLATSPEPTIAFMRDSALHFGRKVGGLTGTWITQLVDANGGSASLAYGPDGQPAMAYSVSDTAKFVRWNPVAGTWDGLDGTAGPDVIESGPGVSGRSLAFNPVTGQPTLVYSVGEIIMKGNRYIVTAPRAVHMATWDGTRWNITVVDGTDDYYFGTAIAFDAGGTPYVAYNFSLDAIKVASLVDGAWHYDEVGYMLKWPDVDIAMNPVTDKPAVIYASNAIYLARMR